MMKDDPNLAEEYQDTIIGIKKQKEAEHNNF